MRSNRTNLAKFIIELVMDADTSPPARRSHVRWLVVVLVLALCSGGYVLAKREEARRESILNYKVVFGQPSGWDAIDHSPQALFLYRNKTNHLLLRGAVNQIIADENPTPELDAAGLAEYYIEATRENMKDWTAQKLQSIECKDVTYSLIRRERKGKCVVTAYAVKGNTTLLISLSGDDSQVRSIDPTLPEFEDYLRQIHLQQQDMTDL